MTNPKNIIIGVIVCLIAVLGGIGMMNEIRTVEPSFFGDNFTQFNATFDKYSQLDRNITSMRTTVENSNVGTGLWGILEGIMISVWSVVKNIFSSLQFINVMLGGLNTYLGIPSWFGSLIFGIVVVVIAFWVFGIVFQGQSNG